MNAPKGSTPKPQTETQKRAQSALNALDPNDRAVLVVFDDTADFNVAVSGQNIDATVANLLFWSALYKLEQATRDDATTLHEPEKDGGAT